MSVREKLEKHGLFKALIPKSIEVMNQLSDLDVGEDGFIRPEFNYYQYYIFSSAKALTELVSWFGQLELSLVYIEHQEAPKELEAHGVNHVTDLQFKLENHLVRLESLYDRLLMLANCLLKLGISDNSLSHELVVGNDNVKYYKTDAPIKSVKAVLKPYKEIRNSIIHHRSYNEPAILDLSALHYLENVEYDLEELKIMKCEMTSEEMAKLLKGLYVEEFKEVNKKLCDKLTEVLNHLLNIFQYEEEVAKVKHHLTTASTGHL